LMAQPAVAQLFFANPLMAEQGLLSRILVAWPTSTAGSRLYQEVDLQTDSVMEEYNKRIATILQKKLPLAENKRNELSPRRLPLTDDAKALWIKFHNTIEAQLKDGEPLAPIRGFANKAPEHAARLAGTLTLVEKLAATTISPERIGDGI